MQKKRLLYVIGLSMKLIASQIILSTVFAVAAFANDANGQGVLDKLVTINAQNTEVKTIITELRRKTEVEFIYSTNTIQTDRKISVIADEKKLGDILNEILKPLNIGYKVVNEQILLYRLTSPNVIINEEKTLPGKNMAPLAAL
ncbi:MAG: STN domain-containing protein [Ferruginibacter sp.]